MIHENIFRWYSLLYCITLHYINLIVILPSMITTHYYFRSYSFFVKFYSCIKPLL